MGAMLSLIPDPKPLIPGSYSYFNVSAGFDSAAFTAW